jgi:hypothetical protein
MLSVTCSATHMEWSAVRTLCPSWIQWTQIRELFYMPTWDPSISLGNILTIVGFVVSLVSLHVTNVKRFERMETKVDFMFDWFKEKLKGN